MLYGVQYYRPPFPEHPHWREDFQAIRNSGLNTVQLWICWGWVESKPGQYDWSDYDQLMQIAGEQGLAVVLSVLPEIQPFWILREFPDASLVDHMGHQVISSLRKECNVGLTPGGCFDHPGIQAAMERFLVAAVVRYRHEKMLRAWDIWNELRWAVQSDGAVCYCPWTVASYRSYLKGCYGSLEKLNRAFKRRYDAWEDVMPGKVPGRPYTDLMMFQEFLTWRANQHLAFRSRVMRQEDPCHPLEAHSSEPSVYWVGVDAEQALSRGNDWDMADFLDVVGASEFPDFDSPGVGQADLGVRLQATVSSAQNKPFWVSELQGASGRYGLDAGLPLDAEKQVRWLWHAVGRGAQGILYWAWRDEVFGSEASGFGLSGHDGKAEQRLARVRETAHLFACYSDLLANYHPDPPRVGLWFEPGTYYLEWAEFGRNRTMARDSVVGYGRALESLGIAYAIIESSHLESLDALDVLVMPWPLVGEEGTAMRLAKWVHDGGTLLVESELGAFDRRGFYRTPLEGGRSLADRLQIQGAGRRVLPVNAMVEVHLAAGQSQFPVSGWYEPQSVGSARTVGWCSGKLPIVHTGRRGQGTLWTMGTFAGASYVKDPSSGLRSFLRAVLSEAGVVAPLTPQDEPMYETWTIGTGTANAQRLLFLTGPVAERWDFRVNVPQWQRGLRSAATVFGADRGVRIAGEFLQVSPNADGVAVLVWPEV